MPPTTVPSTTVPGGPRMLYVGLISHPSGGACVQPGAQVELTFAWESAEAATVRVQRPDGQLILKNGPPSGSVTYTLTCAQMPSLFRFYPVAADGTVGPPWNFNV